MSGISLQRSGFNRVPDLFYSIVTDLIANGFSLQFPAAPLEAPVAGTDYAAFDVTLGTTPALDPLQTTQPWSIHFRASAAQIGDVFVATPMQLPADGTVAVLETSNPSDIPMPAGMLNATGVIPKTVSANTDYSDVHFVCRTGRIDDKATAVSYPMSYRLTITSHGIALIVWEDASDNSGIRHSWLVVQRPVDRLTGAPLVTGHCPVVCVFSLKSKPMKFIVRENDVLKPTIPVPADYDTEDSHAILNSKNQVAITENNKYVISFPNGLNTPRYMYTEEIDLIGFTSADVVSAYSDVNMTVYGEAQPRTYTAMQANAPYNTGMRLLMLKQGSGIA